MRSTVLISLVILCLAAGAAIAQAPVYHVTNLSSSYDLGLSTGASEITGVNDSGEACGYLWQNPNGPAFAFYYKNGIITPIPGASDGSPYAINANGQITGYAPNPSGSDNDAYIFGKTGLQWLPDSADGGVPYAGVAINDSGHVTGSITTYDPVAGNGYGIFLYRSGVTQEIMPNATATGINDRDEVVGYDIDPTTGCDRAFLYQHGDVTYLGDFGGSASAASAIDKAGDVVGWASLPNGSSNAFIYSNGQLIDLGVPAGTFGSAATAINNNGEIVGQTNSYTTDYGAFVYIGGQMYDLGTLLEPAVPPFVLLGASAVSDNGQIAALAQIYDQPCTVLLTPDNAPGSPSIAGVSPQSVRAETNITTLTITGSGFTSHATIDWNNAPLATHYVSSTKLTAEVPTSINGPLPGNTYPGTVNIVAVNPTGASAPSAITVTEPHAVITSLSPSTVPFNSQDTELDVHGQGFTAGSVVMFGKTALVTGLYTPEEILIADIPASLLTTPRTVQVSVVNPSGYKSASLPFTITGTNLHLKLGPASRDSSNNVDLPLTLTNQGPNPASPLQVNEIGLEGSAALTPVPIDLGTVEPGQSQSFTVSFANPKIKSGKSVSLYLFCSYPGGTNTFRTTFILP